jgi:hypothetical protein
MNEANKIECSNPALQRQVYRWALVKGNSEPEPQDTQLAEHIRSCPACQQAVLDWKRKSLGWKLWEEARRIASGTVQPGERVDTKTTPSGMAFFRHPRAAGESGLLILADREGQVQSIDATAALPDFERLSAEGSS